MNRETPPHTPHTPPKNDPWWPQGVTHSHDHAAVSPSSTARPPTHPLSPPKPRRHPNRSFPPSQCVPVIPERPPHLSGFPPIFWPDGGGPTPPYKHTPPRPVSTERSRKEISAAQFLPPLPSDLQTFWRRELSCDQHKKINCGKTEVTMEKPDLGQQLREAAATGGLVGFGFFFFFGERGEEI